MACGEIVGHTCHVGATKLTKHSKDQNRTSEMGPKQSKHNDDPLATATGSRGKVSWGWLETTLPYIISFFIIFFFTPSSTSIFAWNWAGSGDSDRKRVPGTTAMIISLGSNTSVSFGKPNSRGSIRGKTMRFLFSKAGTRCIFVCLHFGTIEIRSLTTKQCRVMLCIFIALKGQTAAEAFQQKTYALTYGEAEAQLASGKSDRLCGALSLSLNHSHARDPIQTSTRLDHIRTKYYITHPK
ncbi:hypothetical protein CRG98_038366 [Punica granatum]|uniref:Uncharacterized protein n=1 Tax=Punica granatum TaxID=22663 RepID=A0A2I0IB77_PUNGR|nr:hypothetical protein CRG98_038366 [Punica granatum]